MTTELDDIGDVSFLGNCPELLSTELPPKSTPETAGLTLQRIFPEGDISAAGDSVRASAVLQLYDTLYDRIKLAEISTVNQEDVRKLSDQVEDLRKQLRASNRALLRHALQGPSEPGSNDDEVKEIDPFHPKKLLALQKEKYLMEHRPKTFSGTGNQIMVMDFMEQVEHFVRMGGGYGPTDSDRCIDVVVRFVAPEVYEWIATVWIQRRGVSKQDFPPKNGSYGDETTWTHFRTHFVGRFVTSATRQQVKKEFGSLRLGNGDVIAFNHQCRKLLRVITDGKPLTEIHRDNDYFMQYVAKLSSRYQEIIINNHLQRADLINAGQTGIQQYSLQDAMTVAEEQRAFTSGAPSSFIPSTAIPPASYAVNTAPHFDPDAMDLSAIEAVSSNAQCYNCKGYGHLAKTCSTPDNREKPGGSRSRAANWRDRSYGNHMTPRGGGMSRGGRGRSFRGREMVVVRGGRREIMLVEDDGLSGYTYDDGQREIDGENSLHSEKYYLEYDIDQEDTGLPRPPSTNFNAGESVITGRVESLESGKDSQ
jgi:hypothetical protein